MSAYSYQHVLMLTVELAFIQEEKLEPLKNINDDPRIRLLNRLYAKKRKELQERQKLKVNMIKSKLLYYHQSMLSDIRPVGHVK
jgi:hypothetical protein